MQKMKRHRIPFGIWPYEVVRPLQAIQDDSSIKFTETNYRSGTKRKTTFFRFLGIVNLIGNLTHKLLRFLVFRRRRQIFSKTRRNDQGKQGEQAVSFKAYDDGQARFTSLSKAFKRGRTQMPCEWHTFGCGRRPLCMATS